MNQGTNYQHLTKLLQASLPHIGTQSKANVEILIKAGELFESISNHNSQSLSACDIANEPIDFEALFHSLQAESTPTERELLNTMLNFFKTQKLYRTYQNMKAFLPKQESNSFAQNKLLPLIENFFQSQKDQLERSTI